MIGAQPKIPGTAGATGWSGPRFGVFAAPLVDGLDHFRALVGAAEQHGLDYVAVQDHPYAPAMADSLALIAFMLGETERIRFATNVANLPMRPPVMLAKAAATLDIASGGRFILGLGAGRQFEEIRSLGGPDLRPKTATDAFAEALGVIRAIWSPDQTTTFAGDHYVLRDVATGPVPRHGVPLWTGAAGPRMLELTGRLADGWIAPLARSFADRAAMQDRIDDAARAAGRDPAAIRRVQQIAGVIDRTRPDQPPPSLQTTPAPFVADASSWVRALTAFADQQRFDTFTLVLIDARVDQIVAFADEVVPAVREAINRSAPPSTNTRTA